MPSDPMLLAQVGRAYQALGEWERAHEYYQRAMKLAPDEVAYRDKLAYAGRIDGSHQARDGHVSG